MIQLLCILIACVSATAAAADPVMFQRGEGTPNVLQRDGRAMWSEPPDLNGLLGSSEQILQFGLETEIANDFVPTLPLITHATWWGGYWNNSAPCDPGIPTPGFNLEFFEDASCVPGALIANISAIDFTEEFLVCQQGYYPMYEWSSDVTVSVTPGDRYWFCPQLKDHPFPPQCGRLSTESIRGCDSMFRSVYFSHPDWTPACDPDCYDFSQEFEGSEATPARVTTWGQIKALAR